MKKFIAVLLITLCSSALYAQTDYNDYVEREAKRSKTGGMAMLVGGVAMIGGGAAMVVNDSKTTKAMGAGLLTAGVGLDIGSIFMFRKKNQILDDARARENVPISLLVSPQGLQLVGRF